MKEEAVASARYARALFDAAVKSGAEDKVREDLEDLVGVIRVSGLQAYLESPSHSPANKKKAVDRVSKMLREPVSGGFLNLLLKKARLRILPGVLMHYTQLLRDARGIVRAELATAGVPNDAFKKRLIESLGRITGRKIDLVVKQDPSLVGGFVVKIGNTLIDASVKSRLAELKKQLLETSVN